VVEGARLLSEWRVISPPEGSNPSLSASRRQEVKAGGYEASNLKPQAASCGQIPRTARASINSGSSKPSVKVS
jgi:hypothetical protein